MPRINVTAADKPPEGNFMAGLGYTRSAAVVLRPAEGHRLPSRHVTTAQRIIIPDFFFQFFPESVSDSKGSNWVPLTIPGASHPLYQWTSGGERTISFTGVFATDTNSPDLREKQLLRNSMVSATRFLYGSEGKYSRNIAAAIGALRWYLYPDYDNDGKLSAPARAYLTLENSGIAGNWGDTLLVVMEACDAEIRAFFPDGTPRLASMAMRFKEVIQYPEGGIDYHARSELYPADYVGNGSKNSDFSRRKYSTVTIG